MRYFLCFFRAIFTLFSCVFDECAVPGCVVPEVAVIKDRAKVVLELQGNVLNTCCRHPSIFSMIFFSSVVSFHLKDTERNCNWSKSVVVWLVVWLYGPWSMCLLYRWSWLEISSFSSHADDCDWIYSWASVYSTIMIGFIKAVISGWLTLVWLSLLAYLDGDYWMIDFSMTAFILGQWLLHYSLNHCIHDCVYL